MKFLLVVSVFIVMGTVSFCHATGREAALALAEARAQARTDKNLERTAAKQQKQLEKIARERSRIVLDNESRKAKIITNQKKLMNDQKKAEKRLEVLEAQKEEIQAHLATTPDEGEA